MPRPFEGIRVIDATHVLAGPFATYQLALFGADVIKVEDPNDPDQSRMSGSDRELSRKGMGVYYLTQGSNKRSIALDLKTADGREIFKRLIATADVLVENYRPGAFDALGLGYDNLSAIRPRLTETPCTFNRAVEVCRFQDLPKSRTGNGGSVQS